MSQLGNRRSVLVWVVALTAAVVLGVVLATDGPASGTAKAEPVDRGGTLPVGSALPSAEQCAAYANQRGSDREARPENRDANQSVPTNLMLPPWPDFWDPLANRLFVTRIDGQYTGTGSVPEARSQAAAALSR
jgi:hypothetical protein